MSTKKYEISHISKRVLSLSNDFPTAKAFLEKCEISNFSLITDIKKGRMKTPGAEYLEQIVRGTGCSGTWLLTGEGEKYLVRENINLAADKKAATDANADQGNVAGALLNQAFALLSRIEDQVGGPITDPLPGDVELVLSRLLHTSLERRHKVDSGD